MSRGRGLPGPCRLPLLRLRLLAAVGMLAGCAAPGVGERPWALPPAGMAGAGAPAGDAPVEEMLPQPLHPPPPPPGAESSLGPLPLDEPLQTLLEAARRTHRLRTLRGFVEQRVILHDVPMTLQIRFFFARPDRLRYEHLAPHAQVLISDGRTLWLLPPSAMAARDGGGPSSPAAGPGRGPWLQRPLSALSPTERSALGLLPGYGFDPLAPLPVDGHLFRFAHRSASVAEVVLQPRDDAARLLPALAVELAPRLGVVTRMRYFADARGETLAAETSYGDFREALPGVFFPWISRTVWHLPDRAELVVESRFAGLRFNEGVDGSRFVPELPPG